MNVLRHNGVEVGNSSKEDEISDTEVKEYTDLQYKLFRFRDYKVKVDNGEFKCPFCAFNDETGFHYSNLLQHSIRVAEESTSQKERAKHSAMARYLAIDLADDLKLESQQQHALLTSRKRSRYAEDSAAEREREKEMLKEALDKVDELETKIIEMNVEMSALIASNSELQGVRNELIKGLGDMNNDKNGDIFGIKNMGELDPSFFIGKLGSESKGVEVCTLWQERIKNPHWYPFQIVIDDNGKPQRVVREDDLTLQSLKAELGEAIHDKVVEAMTDLLEHNPSGCYPVPVLWNFGEGKKAALDEVIRHVFRLQAQSVTDEDEDGDGDEDENENEDDEQANINPPSSSRRSGLRGFVKEEEEDDDDEPDQAIVRRSDRLNSLSYRRRTSNPSLRSYRRLNSLSYSIRTSSPSLRFYRRSRNLI